MKQSYNWLLKVFILWRLGLLAIAALAIKLLPFKPSFPYAEVLLQPHGSPLFWSWANFDGVHYLGIATQGYFAQFTQAFFPLYPLLVRLLDQLINNTILTGLLISHISFFAFLVVFYRLLRLDVTHKIAQRAILFLVLFPTSFFFGSVYTESLFMLFIVTAFYLMRQRHFVWAGLAGALAASTRILGIVLIPALILEYSQYSKKKFNLSWLVVLLPAAGLLLYMYYLNQAFHDPVYFLHAQPAFGAERSGSKLILLYQVFWRYTKMLTTVPFTSLLYYTVSQEFVSALIFLFLSLLTFKFTRRSYAAFTALAYLIPTLTGTFSSLPRYVLVLFPAFIILAKIKNSQLRFALLAVSALLLAINTALFTRGFWVS